MPYHEFLCVNQPRALIFVWSAVTLINHQNLIYLIRQCCLGLQSNALPCIVVVTCVAGRKYLSTIGDVALKLKN